MIILIAGERYLTWSDMLGFNNEPWSMLQGNPGLASLKGTGGHHVVLSGQVGSFLAQSPTHPVSPRLEASAIQHFPKKRKA